MGKNRTPPRKNVVTSQCLGKAGLWACKCRLLEVTRADSRDQHVQTPEVAKRDAKDKTLIIKH